MSRLMHIRRMPGTVSPHDEEFNATEYILEHVNDSHEWHILTKKDGHHVSVPLPVILYSKHSGFHIFSSSKIAHGHNHNGFQMGHGTMEVMNRRWGDC